MFREYILNNGCLVVDDGDLVFVTGKDTFRFSVSKNDISLRNLVCGDQEKEFLSNIENKL